MTPGEEEGPGKGARDDGRTAKNGVFFLKKKKKKTRTDSVQRPLARI